MIAEALMIAGEAETVANPQQIRSQNVGLDGQSIPVPTGHLHDRLEAGIQGQAGGGDA